MPRRTNPNAFRPDTRRKGSRPGGPKREQRVSFEDRKHPLEKTVEKAVKRYAKSHGWLAQKWASANYRGVPDGLFVNKHGLTIYIEFKAWRKKLTELQALRVGELRENKAIVFVVDHIDKGKFIIDLYHDTKVKLC